MLSNAACRQIASYSAKDLNMGYQSLAHEYPRFYCHSSFVTSPVSSQNSLK
ncbi:Uncharacterised protein [Yersinia intermedia]|nr:Uncharacterised protein [Yersinia intermedia]